MSEDDDSFHDTQSRSDADGGSSIDSGADDHALFGGDPTGVYAPYLHLRQQQQRAESAMIPLPPRVIGSWKDNHVDNMGVCKCRKSNCLKLYCDCFSAGIHCHVKCSCSSCHNTNRNPQHLEWRQKAIISTLKRDPHAFRPKLTQIPDMAAATIALARASGVTIDAAGSSTAKTKRCNCKKSLCLKKYCECFGASRYCTDSCRCVECQNVQENMDLKHSETKQKSKAERRQAILEGSSHSLPALAEQVQQAAVAIPGGATGSDATYANNILPPSRFTIPMMLNQNGTESLFPAISFGMARGKRKRKLDGEPSESGESRPENHRALVEIGAQGHPTSDVAMQPAAAADGGTSVERYWEQQVKRVRVTFDGVRDEMSKEDGPENGLTGKELDEQKARFQGSALYKTVNQDLNHVVELMKHAEQNASEMMRREQQKRDEILSKEEKALLECTEELEPSIVDLEFDLPSPQKTQQQQQQQQQESGGIKSMAENGDIDRLSLLICDEELEGPESVSIPAESAPRNLTIALAQDVALIRGLTQFVRRETLEMTRSRMANMELVEN